MPRFEADSGDAGVGPPDRFGSSSQFYAPYQSHTGSQKEDPALIELERRLNEEVDEEFFEEPRKFHTLQRVIDVLGLQMVDDATMAESTVPSGKGHGVSGAAGLEHLAKNPAYRNLKQQQEIVEGAIEHMAVIHCADLNGSVIQVGRVSRQFTDAVSRVRALRKQVRDIQDGLGASGGANPNEAKAAVGAAGRPQNAAAMSLRELWMKKLECEATLSLLEKLDVIRMAPARFDSLLRPPHCRIGAAVLTLTEALQTMFSDDIAQVGALHKIMEQLMLRKQRAEEIVWDTLSEVVYLRTGNAVDHSPKDQRLPHAPTSSSMSQSVSSGSQLRSSINRTASAVSRSTGTASVTAVDGMVNPFYGTQRRRRFAVDEDLEEREDDSDDDEWGSGASLFSLVEAEEREMMEIQKQRELLLQQEELLKQQQQKDRHRSRYSSRNHRDHHPHEPILPKAIASITTESSGKMMIPIPILEAELDLEQDERRCLEEIALSGGLVAKQQSHHHGRYLPRYLNPVLALKILVECLFLLKRFDDVERVLGEGLEREIRRIVQREQARTFARLQRLQRKTNSNNQSIYYKINNNNENSNNKNNNNNTGLQEFRLHLSGLLSAFGCVMVRLSHLAEILRFRIRSDKELMQKFESPSTVMRSVLSNAYDIMHREIKIFLKACLNESETVRNDVIDSAGQGSGAYEKNLFSLGIVEDNSRPGQTSTASAATRTTAMEMSTPKFVANILCAKSKTNPQIRHALIFRRSVSRWTAENEAMKKELAVLSGEDMSSPSFKAANEQTAISYLDKVIQKELLPVLQEEAVNGTVKGLEHRDAFDPVFDRTLYARSTSNEAQDVDMCKACQAMFDATGPLSLALHRLPPGGEMYTPLVAVLEHVMLTFISRVKQQLEKICDRKTAFSLLEDEETPGNLSSVMEKRRPFTLLLRAYTDGDSLESAPATVDLNKQGSSLMPLQPPATDTPTRMSMGGMKSDGHFEDVADADGVEGEERIMALEVAILQNLLDFDGSEKEPEVAICSDQELMRAACLAHSLLKLANLFMSRLKVRTSSGSFKTLTATRTLQEAVKTISQSGIKLAKFCRLDMILQVVTRMAKVPLSSTIVARDAVRIPSSVNDLGEYLTSVGDNLREPAGNAVTAYTLSSLEQYIPYCMMRVVRVVAQGLGVVAKVPLSMNGIEALDRSGSVLYRDLKGATSFDNSFWDVELAAVSFERSASFIAMMELEMEELIAYYTANRDEFSEDDFILMFSMSGPRRRGDVGQFHMLKRRLE